jgi:phenylacetic acid degradation operon negative regulatory protein
VKKVCNFGQAAVSSSALMIDDLELQPLTARSVVLSTLLGSHPPQLRVRHLIGVGEVFGIAEGTIRVALSRMVAAGDLTASDGAYRLTGRLLERQVRQDDSRSPRTRAWDGKWEIAVVAAERRPAAERATLRHAMAGLRLAELREGTWLRPANLDRERPTIVTAQCALFEGRPETNPVTLAASLWDLDGWARRAGRLRTGFDRATGAAEQFTVSAAALRHLLADPLLPTALLPADWPGEALRATYDRFEASLRDLFHSHR